MSSIEDTIEEALQRGRRIKLELLQRSGGLLSANQTAAKLGISSQALEALTSLIALRTDGEVAGYPAFQFESQAMLKGIAKLLAAIQVDDPWSRLNFCFLRLQELNGRTPVEAIRAGEIDAVVLAASHFGEHGAS